MAKRKTTEEYLKECKDKGLDLPVEKYINSRTKIKHKCKNGHVYEQTPNKHLHRQQCPKCSLMNETKTTKEYIGECKAKGLDLPVEDYVDRRTKIKHKCKNGHVYEQTPGNHLTGYDCRYCAGNLRKTPNAYLQECKDKGLDLPFDEKYMNARTQIKFKCKRGHIYKQTPSNHLRGDGCPYCPKSHKSAEWYFKECSVKGLDLPIEVYINNSVPLKHKCKYGHIYLQRPHNHLSGQACPYCSRNNAKRKG